MNVMIKSDLITMKNSAAQLILMLLIVAAIITGTTGSLTVGVAAVTIMVPFLYLLSISSSDEMGGWERFRLTLPLTRRQVAYGRYASIFIVVILNAVGMLVLAVIAVGINALLPEDIALQVLSATENPPEMLLAAVIMVIVIALTVSAITYPLIMRFGLTKGTRWAPVVLVLLIALGIGILGDSSAIDVLVPTTSTGELWSNIESASLPIGLGSVGGGLVLFILSALLSGQLYERSPF